MFNEFIDNGMDLLEATEFNLLIKDDEYSILEANISVDQIGAPKNKNKKPRNILITGSGDSSHQGRMKVSKYGKNITRKSSHDDYISIYRKDKNTISYDGNLKNIDMKPSEYEYYKELFIRNENIIQLVKDEKGKYDEYVDDVLIQDEQNRLNGFTVIRDKDGNASIYNKDGKLDHKENIKGEEIK